MYSQRIRKNLISSTYSGEKSVSIDITGLKLWLDKNVLVPHPDTISLIKKAQKLILEKNINVIADIGTGSGFIALSLANAFPYKKFYATDISKEALALAQCNAQENDIKNIEFILNTDKIWLNEIKNIQVDLIVSNPPFVGRNEYFSKKFIKNFPEVTLEPGSAICTCDDCGEEPFIKIMQNAANSEIPYIILQGNSTNLKHITSALKNEFKDYVFTLHYLRTKPKFIVAQKI